MEFTKWEYSKKIDLGAAASEVQTGLRTLKINNAFYDPEKYQYTMEVEDIEDGNKYKLSYWLMNVDKKIVDGVLKEILSENKTSNGTMATLGKALYGDEYDPEIHGILAPLDIIGRVVIADVKLSKPSSNGIQYPRVYQFTMAYEADSWASEKPQKFRTQA